MIAAAVIAGAQIVQGISALSGGNKNDPDRLAANQQALSQAVNGDADALAFLKQRSGKFGVAYVNGYGEIGGWATQIAKDDAWQKYQTALAGLSGADTVGQVVNRIGDTAQTVAQATGNTIVPGTKQDITIVLIVGALVLFMFARRKR